MSALDADALARLSALASACAGFSAEAIAPEALQGLARSWQRPGTSIAQCLQLLASGDAGLIADLQAAVAVGETYFFRQPEHFQFLHAALTGRARVAAWSAGCATGEEAYSLAATLLAASPAGSVQVLGTDLVERNLSVARRGEYGGWSRRDAGPLLFPLCTTDLTERLHVIEAVRAPTRFARHNLLDAPPAGPFDVILCRNVLGYFTPAAAARAVAHLCSALAPEGFLICGVLDLPAPPPGLIRQGHAELQIFRRPPLPKPLAASAPAARSLG